MNGFSVSSEDVIESYRRRISDLIYENALLEAKIAKLLRERESSSRPSPTRNRQIGVGSEPQDGVPEGVSDVP